MSRKNVRRVIRISFIILMLWCGMTVEIGSHCSNERSHYVQAETKTTKYITGISFINKLMKAMEVDIDSSKELPYVDAAFNLGLLQQDEIENLDDSISRTDCALLLNRADIYLNGETLKEDYIQTIIQHRISDIKKVPETKRVAVASIYGKGIIKGYSNGMGVQSREFRGENFISNGTAKQFIDLLMHPEKRAKLSPDGKVIRTTNLPKNADKFEYILECYPNKFYDMKFYFQRYTDWDEKKQTLEGVTLNKDFYYPEFTKKAVYKNFYNEYPMCSVMDKYLDVWMKRVEDYLNLVFNVDYRTMGNSWVKSMVKASGAVGDEIDNTAEVLDFYVRDMKRYKTVIKSKVISVEPSTLYHGFEGYYVRTYVTYKVSATEIPKDQKDLIFSTVYTDVPDLKLNTWQTGVFDIMFDNWNGFNGDGSALYPSITNEIYSPY